MSLRKWAAHCCSNAQAECRPVCRDAPSTGSSSGRTGTQKLVPSDQGVCSSVTSRGVKKSMLPPIVQSRHTERLVPPAG